MSTVTALVSVSVPGLTLKSGENPLFNDLMHRLTEAGVEWEKVDSMAGWFNLNQDWVEFETTVHTSWGPVQIDFGSQRGALSKWLSECLHQGFLIAQIHYVDVDPETGEKSYTPHF